MILEAKDVKDFTQNLIQLATVDTRMNFEGKISKIKELGMINTDYYKTENGSICDSYNKSFNIHPTSIYNHKINMIINKSTYDIIIAHGIERIIRSMFRAQQVRKLIELILKGDTQLKNIIFDARIMVKDWKYYKDNSGDIKPHVCMMFPFSYDNKTKGIWINESISDEYTKYPSLSILLFSLIYGKLSIPIGNYDVTDTIQDSSDKDRYEIIDGKETDYLSYQLIPDLNSYKSFAEESTVEKVFNSTKKIAYPATPLFLQRIETEIYENSTNRNYIKMIMNCLISLVYNDKPSIFEGLRLIGICLENIDTTLDTWILNNNLILRNKIFVNIIRKLKTTTLFSLSQADNIRVVDEFSVTIENHRAYIVKVIIERFKPREELNFSIRQFLNQSQDSNDILSLLKIFNKVYPEE